MPTKAELEESAAKQKAASEARDEAAAKKLDETVPGGKYIQGEYYVNANGDILGEVPKAEAEKK